MSCLCDLGGEVHQGFATPSDVVKDHGCRRGALSPRMVDAQWIAKILGIGRASVYRVLEAAR